MALPSTFVGLLVFCATVAPGFFFVRAAELRRPRDTPTNFREVAEIVSIGACATAISSTLLLLIGEHWHALVSLADLSGPSLKNYASRVALSLFLALTLSAAIATGAGIFVGRRPPGATSDGTVWTRVLGNRENGYDLHVQVELKDGRMVEGRFLSVSSVASPAEPDLALASPIAFTTVGGVRIPEEINYVLLPGAQIKLATVLRIPNGLPLSE